MLLQISDATKRKLSVLIRYFRTREYALKEPLDWSVHDFPVDQAGETICSHETLSQIENGSIIKNDDIYERLLAKLGKSINFEADLTVEIARISNDILNAQNAGDDSKILYSVNELQTLLLPYSSYVVEAEYLRACAPLLSYYEEDILSDEARVLFDLYPMFDSQFQLCLQPMLYSYSYSKEPEALNDRVKQIHLSDSRALVSRLRYAHFLCLSKKFFMVPIILSDLHSYYEMHPSTAMEIDLLDMVAYYNMCTNSTDLRPSIHALTDFLDTHHEEIAVSKQGSYYYNLAIYSLHLKEIDDARKYLQKALNFPAVRLQATLQLLLLSSRSEIELPAEILSNICRYENRDSNPTLSKILRYYALKAGGADLISLEEYIMTVIRSLFVEVNDEYLYEVFLLELERLTKATGNIQKLKNYKRVRVRKAKRK